MTSLAQYEKARAALAEATRIDEILPLRAEVEHLKLYARQIQDRALLADAHVFQMRVERKLGTVIIAAKEAGHITQGRQAERKTTDEEVFRVNLPEIGVSHKLSAQAQKQASIAEEAFEKMVAAMRERVLAGKARLVGGDIVNGARAIMGSRAEPDDSLDYFPTPPWATRALIEKVLPRSGMQASLHAHRAWEPACGEGHIAGVLQEYFGDVVASDIHDYSADGVSPPGWHGTQDFLAADVTSEGVDWIVTNPPFGDKAEAFILRALERADVGVAMFLRLQWLETVGRYERVFSKHPPYMIAQFAERVPLHKGRWEPDGDTATAYLWIIWLKRRTDTSTGFMWIPPGQRDGLTRIDDIKRFTAHPVVAYEPCDPETGEIPEAPSSADLPAPAAVSTPAAGDDNLDIPAFLRRTRPEAAHG